MKFFYAFWSPLKEKGQDEEDIDENSENKSKEVQPI